MNNTVREAINSKKSTLAWFFCKDCHQIHSESPSRRFIVAERGWSNMQGNKQPPKSILTMNVTVGVDETSCAILKVQQFPKFRMKRKCSCLTRGSASQCSGAC